MERIALLHDRLLTTLVLLLGVLLLWGLACVARGSVGRGYIAGLWVAQLLIVAQGLLGVLLLVTGGQVVLYALHAIYGVTAAFFLPAAIAYNRGRAGRREALVYAGACVFLLGVLARTATTSG